MTTIDARFDEAEADVDHGAPWRFREPDAPNPLTILASHWSTGITKIGEAEFLCGTDRDGKAWSILVGNVVLTKRLIEGLVEEWDDDRRAFVVVETLGRVQAGEIVSLKYLGDVEGARYTYPNFRVSRKPATSTVAATAPADETTSTLDDDIPFQPACASASRTGHERLRAARARAGEAEACRRPPGGVGAARAGR